MKRNKNKQSIDSKVDNNLSNKSNKSLKVKTICRYPQHLNDVSINWKRLNEKLNSNKSCDKKINKNQIKNTNKIIENKVNHKNNKIWFDGVDKCLITSSMTDINSNATNSGSDETLVKQKSFAGLTQIVAMDCEMVGTGTDGQDSILARISIVNFFGHLIYDKYVKPTEEITDYRTHVSGIRPSNLVNALDFKTVQKEVHEILKDRTLVGHAIHNDLKALYLSHPKHMIRDTSKYFKKLYGGRRPALKKLSEAVLGVKVQTGEHDSVEDARVAMRLFTMFRKKWETDIRANKRRHQNKTQKSK